MIAVVLTAGTLGERGEPSVVFHRFHQSSPHAPAPSKPKPSNTPKTVTKTVTKTVFTLADIRPHGESAGTPALPSARFHHVEVRKVRTPTVADLVRAGLATVLVRDGKAVYRFPSHALQRVLCGPDKIARARQFIAECERDRSLRDIAFAQGIDIEDWAEQIETEH